MALGCTDSEPALESEELVEVLVAAAVYHLVNIDTATVAEPYGQV